MDSSVLVLTGAWFLWFPLAFFVILSVVYLVGVARFGWFGFAYFVWFGLLVLVFLIVDAR